MLLISPKTRLLICLVSGSINAPIFADEPPARINSNATLELAGLQDRFTIVSEWAAKSAVSVVGLDAGVDTSAYFGDSQPSSAELDDVLAKAPRSVGSGVALTSDGYILTSAHVVADRVQFLVTTDDGHVYPAFVVGSDPRSDLAVLKCSARGLRAAQFSQTPLLRRGQWIIACGNPAGMSVGQQNSIGVGVISATDRALPKLARKENRIYSGLIQTTCELAPGSSGGPIFDLDGRVIGIVAAVVMRNENVAGMSFAIPMSLAIRDRVEKLVAGEKINHSYLGLTVRDSPERHSHGVWVDAVDPQSPCATIVQDGDCVMNVNGRPIDSPDSFTRLAGSLQLDRPSELRVMRGDKIIELSVTPRERVAEGTPVTRKTQKLLYRGTVYQQGDGVVLLRDESNAAGNVAGPSLIPVRSVNGQSVTTLVGMLDSICRGDRSRAEIQIDRSAPAVSDVR